MGVVDLDWFTDLSARFRPLGDSQSSNMRTFFHQYREDLQVIADLRGKSGLEDLLRMRAKIDRMRSQNMRQAALAIWNEKFRAEVRGDLAACPGPSPLSAARRRTSELSL